LGLDALIFQPTPADIPEMGRFANSVFGVHGEIEKRLQSYFDRPQFRISAARADDGIVALGVASYGVEAALEKYDCFGPAVTDFLRGRLGGSVHMLGVAPDWRGRGLGKKMGRALLRQLREAGAEIFFGTSWDNGTVQNSAVLFESAGFKRIAESATFLNQQSRLHGFTCRVCGGECHCRSFFYGLIVT